MARGIVVSDLHLFTHRSDTPFLTDYLYGKTGENDFILLNGDIFDFRWSVYKTSSQARHVALEWLKGLIALSPSCHVYYVLGNHDCDREWARALDEIEARNFSWSSSHFWIGKSLFLHGDLPLRRRDPYKRDLPETRERPLGYVWAEKLYDLALFIRFHRLVGLVFTPERCADRLYKTLKKADPDRVSALSDVYFGHTHVPFSGYCYQGILFHNTGSSVRYLRMNTLSVEI